MKHTLKIDAVTVSANSMVADSHFCFRGRFALENSGIAKLKLLAGDWFESWLDGQWLTEGPARFEKMHPEYELIELALEAGSHLLALHVHYQGIQTRLNAAELPPFVFAQVEMSGTDIPIEWNWFPLEAYRRTGRRITCIKEWIEWCDTSKLPQDWQGLEYDDSSWEKIQPLSLEVSGFKPVDLARIQHIQRTPGKIAGGRLVNMSTFGHDPCAGFVSRQLENLTLPEQGIWARYDLGKVRLGRPEITVKASAGTVMQIAYTEFLINGRVSPYMSQAGGGESSCHLDHYVLSGGVQRIKPFYPKGARFFEIHVIGDPAAELLDAEFDERVYYGDKADGSFRCSDELLNRIWSTGVDTLRSCSEDAVTDNPTRERGQWLGDVVGPGMDIASVSYADLRPLKRGLLQAAQCAGEDGMIPAVFPGTVMFLPSFAIQWVCAVPHYVELTGDFQTLEKLYPAAEKTIRCFDSDLSEEGLCPNPVRWNFIDWGYCGSATGFREQNESQTGMDPALSLFYLKALQAMIRWAGLLDLEKEAAEWSREEEIFRAKMETLLVTASWERIGYHSAALALGSGLLTDSELRTACIDYIKQHILSCFPNRPDAPRLYDPTVEHSQIITPFFFHHVLPALANAGEMNFVLDQIRVCWGHWLDIGLTTWPEVFDLRWSHCHQWSGCPTWILSRYVLGLHPRFDLGKNHYEFHLEPDSLEFAEGGIPIPYSDDELSVEWKRTNDRILCRFSATVPVTIHFADSDDAVCVTSPFEKTIERDR